MHLNRKTRRRGMSRGWALAEMLLATLVAGVLFAMAMRMSADQQSDLAARTLGENNLAFQAAASQYFLDNRAAMLQAMADGTGAASLCMTGVNPADGSGGAQVNDTGLHTCALDASWLKYKGAIATGFSDKPTRGTRWVAIFRRLYDAANAPTDNAEMLVVAARDGGAFDKPMGMPDLALAAEVTGAAGGFVPGRDAAVCIDKKAAGTYQACGSGGGWKVDLANFISAAELATFANALPN